MVLESINSMINAALIAGFRVDQFGEVSGYPMIGLSKDAEPTAPCAYLSSGIHGDEPASFSAMLTLIKSGAFDGRSSWRIAPILNPTGIAARTRNNENDIDLNRDFRDSKTAEILSYKRWLSQQPPPSLSVSLHEDYEAAGFYLYAIGSPRVEKLARTILRDVAKIGPIELSESIDGHAANGGLILPGGQLDLQTIAEWPEAFHLHETYPHDHFTFESPTSLPIEKRIPMHVAAVKRTIASLRS